MLGVLVREGAVFEGQMERREVIPADAALPSRGAVRQDPRSLEARDTPLPDYTKRCEGSSTQPFPGSV